MSILSASAHCRLVIAFICLFPFSAQSAAPKEKPIDLSIIKQSDALHPYMSFPQRQAYVRAAELVEQGQSDIRSGQNLQHQRDQSDTTTNIITGDDLLVDNLVDDESSNGFVKPKSSGKKEKKSKRAEEKKKSREKEILEHLKKFDEKAEG